MPSHRNNRSAGGYVRGRCAQVGRTVCVVRRMRMGKDLTMEAWPEAQVSFWVPPAQRVGFLVLAPMVAVVEAIVGLFLGPAPAPAQRMLGSCPMPVRRMLRSRMISHAGPLVENKYLTDESYTMWVHFLIHVFRYLFNPFHIQSKVIAKVRSKSGLGGYKM